jgi:hypothetical protein
MLGEGGSPEGAAEGRRGGRRVPVELHFRRDHPYMDTTEAARKRYKAVQLQGELDLQIAEKRRLQVRPQQATQAPYLPADNL